MEVVWYLKKGPNIHGRLHALLMLRRPETCSVRADDQRYVPRPSLLNATLALKFDSSNPYCSLQHPSMVL